MPRARLDWFRLQSGVTRHEKVAQLSDRQFRVWVELLDAASTQAQRGHFASFAAAAAVIRRKPAEVRCLAASGLLDECPDGSIGMHDWELWQRWRTEGEPEFPPRKTPESLTNNTGMTHESRMNAWVIPHESPVIDSRKTHERHANHPRAREEKEKEKETELKDAVAAVAAPASRVPAREVSAAAAAAAISDFPDEVTRRLRMPPIGVPHAGD